MRANIRICTYCRPHTHIQVCVLKIHVHIHIQVCVCMHSYPPSHSLQTHRSECAEPAHVTIHVHTYIHTYMYKDAHTLNSRATISVVAAMMAGSCSSSILTRPKCLMGMPLVCISRVSSTPSKSTCPTCSRYVLMCCSDANVSIYIYVYIYIHIYIYIYISRP